MNEPKCKVLSKNAFKSKSFLYFLHENANVSIKCKCINPTCITKAICLQVLGGYALVWTQMSIFCMSVAKGFFFTVKYKYAYLYQDNLQIEVMDPSPSHCFGYLNTFPARHFNINRTEAEGWSRHEMSRHTNAAKQQIGY
jgi:hypothetical protein